MAKGKCISAEYKGEWKNKLGKSMHDHIIVVEYDGKTEEGTYTSSSKVQNKFIPDKECEFERTSSIVQTVKGPWEKIKFKPVGGDPNPPLTGAGTKFKSWEDDPERQRLTTVSFAYFNSVELITTLLKRKPEIQKSVTLNHIELYMNKIFNFINENKTDVKDIANWRTAFSIAVKEFTDLDFLGTDNLDKVFERTKLYHDKIIRFNGTKN